MAKYVALKSVVGKVTEATESGSIIQFDHEVYYEKGDQIFTDLKGNRQLIPKGRVDEYYIPVEIDEKHIEAARAYGDMRNWIGQDEEDSYINEMKKVSEKYNSERIMFDTEHYCPHSE